MPSHEKGFRTDSTRIIIEKFAESYAGDTLKGLAKYLTRQRSSRSYKYWRKWIKEYKQTAKEALNG